MGSFNKKVNFYTEDPSGHNESKESSIEVSFSSISDAGEIIIKDSYKGEVHITLDKEGFNCLMDILSDLENYTKFFRFKKYNQN